jgi:hypothetical protein
MEAQYAFQKKKPIIPLKLTEGYEADGWLGLLLGTSMWYAFYGTTLSSESAFDSRVDSLCREIGGRGRADAVVDARCGPVRDAVLSSSVASESSLSDDLTPHELDAPSGGDGSAGDSAYVVRLEAMRLKQLRAHAKSEGVSAELLELAADADDPKAALVNLLAARRHAPAKSPRGGTAGLRSLGLKELRRRARDAGVPAEELDAAADSDDPKGAVVELIAAAALDGHAAKRE